MHSSVEGPVPRAWTKEVFIFTSKLGPRWETSRLRDNAYPPAFLPNGWLPLSPFYRRRKAIFRASLD